MEKKPTASNAETEIVQDKSVVREKLNTQAQASSTQVNSYVKDWIDDNNSETTESTYSTTATSDLSEVSDQFDDLSLNNEISLSPTSIQSSSNLNFFQNINYSNNGDGESKNVLIQNSQNVHIGNITVVKGPVIYKQINTQKAESSENQSSKEKEVQSFDDAFIGHIRRRLAVIHIVDRKCWLARKPLLPYDYINKPVDLVIISHTATTSAKTQSENVFLVKNIQSFHVEPPLKWNDIGYNFLIGSDGLVYEGRGWNVVGAHARGYNINSVGISFIGCFMKELPPQKSLDVCKQLIERGVELGHIAKDYKLLGHCQCSVTESPGKCLFDEIKTWEHFYEF